MASYQRMLFVCLNDRGEGHPKGSCSQSGGEAVLDRLRADLHERGLKRVVRAVGTRCLGQCAHGPVVCVHPDDVWYRRVQERDVDAIVEQHVLGGEVVERLRIEEERLIGVPHGEHPLPPLRRASADSAEADG
ncbi:MAG: (2Fe-2S) ferredoxin domain-containing protein [Planctomycetota bacterium]